VTSVLAGAVSQRDLRTSARRLLTELGIGLDTNADRFSVPDRRGTLIVANHISWLDIVATIAVEPTAFLAKHEVRGWPLIGSLAAGCGTVFVDRREMRRLPEVVAGIADALRAGRSVVVFPEGTTWCGRCGQGVFRRAAFQAAIDADAPIRPLTVAYRQDGEPSTVPAFVGDDTIATSLRRVIRADGLKVALTAHPALDPDTGRRELAERAELSVRQVAHV